MIGERPHGLALQHDRPDGLSGPHQRDAQAGAEAGHLLGLDHLVVRIGLDIDDLDDVGREQSPSGERPAPGLEAEMLLHVVVEAGRESEARHLPVGSVLLVAHRRHLGIAQARRGPHQRVEHGAQIEMRAGDELEHVGRRRQRLLALLELGDVVPDAQQALVRQSREGELDVASARGAALVAVAALLEEERQSRARCRLGVGGRAEIAALGHEAGDVLERDARTAEFRRKLVQLHQLPVGELAASVGVEQHDAFAHVVEHRLHHRARALDVGARRGERGLAILQIGDVVVPGQQRLLALVFDRIHRIERPPQVSVGASARDLDVADAALAPRPFEQAGALGRVREQRDQVDAVEMVAREAVLAGELRIAEQQAPVLDRDGRADRAAFQDRAHALLVLPDPPLGALVLGDVAVDRHEPAARQRIVPDLQHRPVGPQSLGRVVRVGVGGDAGDQLLDVDVTILAAPRQITDEVGIARFGCQEV